MTGCFVYEVMSGQSKRKLKVEFCTRFCPLLTKCIAEVKRLLNYNWECTHTNNVVIMAEGLGMLILVEDDHIRQQFVF